MKWSFGAVALAAALLSAYQLPSEPRREFGTSITGAFEGWFENADGSRSFLIGYFNRNSAQEIDVPIGPDNRIEPGGPDLGQPSHFLPGRQFGMFTVPVPKEFTTAEQRLTWTIVANGQTTTIPLRIHPDYNVSPFTDVAVKNTPPVLRFEEQGQPVQGPVARLSIAPLKTTSVSSPLSLTVLAADDGKFASGTMALPLKPPPPVRFIWSKYRGPGEVTFAKEPLLETLTGGGLNVPFSGKSTTTVRFNQPGDYVLHVSALDFSGEGGSGEICCWTTAMVKVSVTP